MLESLRPAAYALVCCWLALGAQDGAFAQKSQVFITASLVDKRGLFIEDLEKQEIRILEDNQPRDVEFMARDEVPTVYGILFDNALLQYEENQGWARRQEISGTGSSKNLAYQLIDKYLGRQTGWVGTYGQELQVVLDFNEDGFRAKDAIQRMSFQRSAGESFLYPALYSSIMRMRERNEKRRVLLLFTNFLDSETAGKIKPLKNLLASSNIELFAISYGSRLAAPGAGLNPAMSQAGLKELAGVTAGDTFLAVDYRDHPEDIAQRIYNQLRTFYTFGFESQSGAESGAKLTIRCTRAGSKIKSHPNVPVIR